MPETYGLNKEITAKGRHTFLLKDLEAASNANRTLSEVSGDANKINCHRKEAIITQDNEKLRFLVFRSIEHSNPYLT
jgi:hypothetical protein